MKLSKKPVVVTPVTSVTGVTIRIFLEMFRFLTFPGRTDSHTSVRYFFGMTAFLKNFPYGSNLGQENFAVLPTVALSSTSVPDASESAGTLPRPKNSPPDCFCTSVRTGAGLSSPIIQKKRGYLTVNVSKLS